jgi:hypothetical protein
MLSAKLAQLNKNGMILSIHSDTVSLHSHMDLITMLGLEHKNIIGYNQV